MGRPPRLWSRFLHSLENPATDSNGVETVGKPLSQRSGAVKLLDPGKARLCTLLGHFFIEISSESDQDKRFRVLFGRIFCGFLRTRRCRPQGRVQGGLSTAHLHATHVRRHRNLSRPDSQSARLSPHPAHNALIRTPSVIIPERTWLSYPQPSDPCRTPAGVCDLQPSAVDI